MSISQFNIVKLVKFGLSAVAVTGLLLGLSGCVAVPYSAQSYGAVYTSPTTTYYPSNYPPVYQQPYYAPPVSSPYYSPYSTPWFAPSYPSYQTYPYNNLPAAQVRPVDNGQIQLNRDGSDRYGPDRSNLPAAQVRPVN